MIRTREGDAVAYEALFARHQRSVYGFLVRRAGDSERAGELFQETWMKVYRGRGTWREGQRFRPWLFGIAINTARDAERRARRRIQTVHIDDAPPAVTRSEAHALRMTLEHAIDALPPNLKEAFLLGAVLGFDHRELAEQLEISPANARTRISRARAQLRKTLKGKVK